MISKMTSQSTKPQSKNNSKYTDSFVPIKNIVNGTIILDSGIKVTGVKIQPRNIFILDYEAQVRAISNLKNFYNTLDYEFWVICADRPVDINLFLSKMEMHYNSTNNPIVKKLINEDIQKANNFANNDIVDTEYYILFQERNEDILQKKIRMLINGLASSGLSASQTTNSDLRLILDNFLNGGSSSEFRTVIV